MAPLQIGIIGGGMIAQAHMQNFVDDPRTELRWLAEVNPVARKASKKKFGIPHAAKSYRRMLQDPGLDAVVVCTPPFTHLRMGLDVIKAGKHLLMEKPLTAELKDAKKLLAAAQAHPELKISGCSARHARLNPKFAFIKEFIDSGKLGDVYYVHHRAIGRQGRGGIEYNPPAKWFLNRALAGGGPLYDWGVYDLSFHLGVLSEPALEKVDSFCVSHLDNVDPGTDVYTVEEHGVGFMTFAGGIKYYWERANNAHAEAPNRTTIYGTKGGLSFSFCTWDSAEVDYFFVDDDGKGKAQKETLTVDMSAHPGDMPALGKAYIDYLCGEGPVPMPLDLEVKNLEIMHKVYKAAKW
jgi:predicted dehydrogenase